MSTPLLGTHLPVDQTTLRRQCEVDHIPMTELHALYGYGPRDIYLYQKCAAWGIKPFRPPGKYDHLKAIPLSDDQKQLVIGSLLGDGSAYVNQRNLPEHGVILRMTQGEDQFDYLVWKMDQMAPFVVRDQPQTYQQTKWSTKKRHVVDTISHPGITPYWRAFYATGAKGVTLEVLQELGPRGLAIWLMDDGSFARKSGWINLATHSFSMDDNDLIAQWFQDAFGIEARMYPLRKLDKWFLCFNRPAVERIRALTSEYFFPPLRYKLGL